MKVQNQFTLPIQTDEEEDFFNSEQLRESIEERKWSRKHLRSQFRALELSELFKKYTDKINFGYFSLFLILTFCLFFTHTIILLTVENIFYEAEFLDIIPDIVCYTIIVLLCAVGLIYLEIAQRKNKSWNCCCFIGFLILFSVNFGLPIYHDLIKTTEAYIYTPAYTFLIIIGCYMFFGVKKNFLAIFLGILTSFIHITILVFIAYRISDRLLSRVFSEVIFLICFNGFGLYCRYLNEIVQRKSFLDRRECIVNTLQLKHEKEQEEHLMASIIPYPLIYKVKQSYINNMENYRKYGVIGSEKPQDLLEIHENITILFADIVNYTEMTKKLNINDLLEILNELFGRFDDASENLKVIRIKFLGDCYYCVSGLPPHIPANPAEACVDLGLKMIEIIANVRQKNDLTIDMRIGVHTGKIISGIIGKVKYQFDIWSKDVDIANKMESEGVAGKVHITNITKDLLNKYYDIVPTNKGNLVQQFKQHNVKTYLISPLSKEHQDKEQFQNAQPRSSIFRKNAMPFIFTEYRRNTPTEEPLTIIESNNLDLEKGNHEGKRGTLYQRRFSQKYRINDERRSTYDVKRRTAFMQSNLKRCLEREAAVNEELENTINQMSFSKKDQYTLKGQDEEIRSGFLLFRKAQTEMQYNKMKDPIFKIYIFGQVFLNLSLYLIKNLTLETGAWVSYDFIIFPLISTGILIPCTWSYYIYLNYFTQYRNDEPTNFFLKIFYHSSKFIADNFWAKLIIYTLMWILFMISVFLEVWFCHLEDVSNDELPNRHCMVPWHLTELCALAIITIFLYIKIFLWIKLLYAFITTIIYIYCILNFVSTVFQTSETFNPHLSPEIPHILFITFFAFTLHLLDRQTNYMNRLDFLWSSKLMEEKRKANEQQNVNTSMLINILPKHVAKIYLDVNSTQGINELYYETHNNAAVMFASMIFDEIYTEHEMSFLQMMNDYITIIDTLINRKEFSKVEKIKIAKWTYMAACGLNIPGENSNDDHFTNHSLDLLLKFASTIFKEFQKHNTSFTQINLRIGISCGSLVAGVVGSKKPLYDIWGDPVNMASRMDSTGKLGNIQVLESTAKEVEYLGYECILRGITKVKGVGEVPTFFVKMDEDYNLIEKKPIENLV